MTSFENCLQGQKIRVSDDEFRDMMDLVHLDQLLAQARAAIRVELHQWLTKRTRSSCN